jgi:hypothetical protein
MVKYSSEAAGITNSNGGANALELCLVQVDHG